MVEILQLVHEISSFPEVLYKRGVLKNFSKLTLKHKNQSSGGVLSKDVLKNFAKFTEKHLWQGLFLKKLQAGNLKLSEAASRRCSVKKGVLKKFGNFTRQTPTQVFSNEFCELFKNTYFVEDLQTAGSETSVQGSFFNKVASLTA